MAVTPEQALSTVHFTDAEIEAARRLRSLDLPWEPAPGHYVLDETGFCKQGSPFQEKVYFILNYPYFMRSVGGVERFKEIMLWLPTWQDLRNSLRNAGVTDQAIADHISNSNAIESGTERLALCELLESQLTSNSN